MYIVLMMHTVPQCRSQISQSSVSRLDSDNCDLCIFPVSHYLILIFPQPQYIFIHDSLLEVIECGETEVSAREVKEQYR